MMAAIRARGAMLAFLSPSALWRNSFARNSASIALGVLLSQAVAFVGGLVLARCYPPATQDLQAAFVSLAITLVPLATLRYEVSIVMPSEESDAAHLFRFCLLCAAATFLLATAAVPAVFALGFHTSSSLWWLPGTLLAQAISATVVGWCNRRSLFGVQTIAKITQAGAFPLVALLLFWLGGAVPAHLPIAYMAASVLGAVMIFGAVLWSGRPPDLRLRQFDRRAMAAVTRRYLLVPAVNLPLYVLNMASLAVLVWSMNHFESGASACFAAITQLLRVPIVLLGMAVGQVFTSRAARLIGEPVALRRLTLKTVMALLLVALAFSLVFTVGGPLLIRVTYGDSWQLAGEFGRWLVWGAGAGLVVTPIAMLPTLLHSNVGHLLISIGNGVARCLVAWWAVHNHQIDWLVIGATVVDILGALVYLTYVISLLSRPARPVGLQVS